MPRNVKTARGESVDFDALILKQQIAQAPMNIEVARRKEFIDAKEGRGRGQRVAAPELVEEEQTDVIALAAEPVEVEPAVQQSPAAEFEIEDEPASKKRK